MKVLTLIMLTFFAPAICISQEVERKRIYCVMEPYIFDNFNELIRLAKLYDNADIDSALFSVDFNEYRCGGSNIRSIEYRFYFKVISRTQLELFKIAKMHNRFFKFSAGTEIPFVTFEDVRMVTAGINQNELSYLFPYSSTLFTIEERNGKMIKGFDFCIDEKGRKVVQGIASDGSAY